ncbi:MAG: UDP-N-acetylmuramate--L-alanine ligase [Pseudomonadota bacterium]|nr:UDP-N-acetylmuramate--L-alanine ligase [Pseudomonadota bacterium]
MKGSMRKIKNIHLVGIGGVGMSGIAEVLLNLGYAVQGSDLEESQATDRLIKQGARFFLGHSAENIKGADVVVVSTAIDSGNPETDAARNQRIPVVRRAEMLAELMRFRFGIAVAGTHGKTTTTSLISSVLAEAGEDPTFLIGGRLLSADTNARMGTGKYLVAEADESDASFTHLQPMLAVVTNIDNDHLATYNGELKLLEKSFIRFLHNLPFYGLVVICIDDPGVRNILPKIKRATLTYGFSEDADIRLLEVKAHGASTEFKVIRPGSKNLLELKLNLPGRHNVLNALAAVAVAFELELSDKNLINAFKSFEGIDRRLQINGEVQTRVGKVLFIDDYAHHPTEIEATLEAIYEAWPKRRLVVIFQPHRYSRSRDLMDDFAEVLSGVDRLIITEVYSAGEQLIHNADGRSICRAIRSRGLVEPIFVPKFESLNNDLLKILEEGDVVLTLGAGDIGSLAKKLPYELQTLALVNR